VAEEGRRGASARLGRARSGSLHHHDLCFGCGQANLFGLQLELSRVADGVEGRFFVKQDHQGPPGFAHAGVLAAALEEAIALAAGTRPTRLSVELVAPAPVGAFVRVRADAASATASNEEGGVLARAEGFHRPA
jgi:acyl-coenzyme A thioesterase PaaI-like protein